jgi:hypothetical protein
MKRPKKNVDKWVAKIQDDDVFIFQIGMRETTKQLRHVPEEPGEGKCTAVGFNGTKQSHRWLLGFNTVFDKNDSRFHNTYEEARNSMIKQIEKRVETAKRQLEKAQALEDLFNSVPYVKQ